MSELPFGVWLLARTQVVLGALLLGGGAGLFRYSDVLAGTPTLFGSYGEGRLATIGLLLMATGVLDLTCALGLTRLGTAGFVVAISCAIVSALGSTYLISVGFMAGAMNMLLNIAVPVHLLRWDVRQEYL